MNIRKPVNYSSMFAALDTLMVAGLPQMKLYHKIGRIVGARTERGAAVAASEYLSKTYPDTSGFSPRNLRRMREFFQAYESNPEVLVQAMAIGWTQNIVILENCETLEERTWYINTVCQFNWPKTELLERISSGSYKSSASAPCTNESAEDQISSSETGLSNKSTSHASSQTDFSQLNPQKMIHWNKQFPQNEQKIDAGHGPASIQNQRCDGLRPANPFRKCPKPMTMELSTKIGCISALCGIRPGLPPLWPPVDRQDNPFPSSRAGYAAQDRKKYGLHQGWKERHYRGPKPRYEAAPHPWFSIYIPERNHTDAKLHRLRYSSAQCLHGSGNENNPVWNRFSGILVCARPGDICLGKDDTHHFHPLPGIMFFLFSAFYDKLNLIQQN